MSKKITLISIFFLLCFFLYYSYHLYTDSRHLEVVFLDVGQGDSILVQKGDQQILIDGGPNGKTELAELGKHLPYFDREIEIVITTHPDRDHIGGLVEVARKYKIGKILSTASEKDTKIFDAWKEITEFNQTETLAASRGTELRMADAVMRIISPSNAISGDAAESNNASVVARLDYGKSSFLFTGDIESPAEREILASGENIDVDILKVAHHGSKYSSSEGFLDATSPKEAVISVGAKNSYGHPSGSVIEALNKRGIEVLRTDEMGDIVFKCENQTCHR